MVQSRHKVKVNSLKQSKGVNLLIDIYLNIKYNYFTSMMDLYFIVLYHMMDCEFNYNNNLY